MNNRIILFVIGILCLDSCRVCYNYSLNLPGYRGIGDPAPGRSPGPPDSKEDGELLVETAFPRDNTIEDLECQLDGTFKEPDKNVVNVTISHRIFKTDVLVPGVTYQVIIRKDTTSKISFSLATSLKGYFSESPQNIHQSKCRPHVFQGRLDSSPLSLNWTFHENKDYEKPNVTFWLNYAPHGDPYVYKLIYSIPISQECKLELSQEKAVVTNRDLPHSTECQVWLPSQETGQGIVIELTRLNVPCSKGFVHFSGLNVTQHPYLANNFVYLKSHKQAHLCGKLEELPEPDRHIHFPSSNTRPAMHLQGNPVFEIFYRLVDYCYNVTFISRNGSFELKSAGELQCTFKIYLPYGHRVALKLWIGDSSVAKSPETTLNFQDFRNEEITCEGLLTQLEDGPSTWSHCTKPGDTERQIEILSRENKVVLKVMVRNSDSDHFKSLSTLGLRMSYRAEPIESVVGVCEFGWVVLRQFCVSAMEGLRLPWAQAEMECTRKGGHLASVRSDHDQLILNNLLTNRLTAPSENYGSVMLKLDIILDNKETRKEETLQLVAKILPESDMWRKIFEVQRTYTNEMAFYEIVLPTLLDFQRELGVQKVLDCFAMCIATRKNLLGDSGEIDDDAVLIFENLNSAGFINVNRFEGFDFETTKLILRDMALFHAVPLALRKKKPELFNSNIKPYLYRFGEGSEEAMRPMIEATKAVLMERKELAHWAQKLDDFVKVPIEPPRDTFATVVHTDLWTNNTMQKFEDGKPVANKFVDFQGYAYGSPAADLFFFLWSSVPQRVLESHLDYLIEYYYDHFIQSLKDHHCDVTQFSFESFLREIEFEFNHEFSHALIFSLTVVTGRRGSRVMDRMPTTGEFLEHIPLDAKKKAWFMVAECERKGWLK